MNKQSYQYGDVIQSSKHKGLIHVDMVSEMGIVGRKIKKDGQISKRNVVVTSVAVKYLRLPGC